MPETSTRVVVLYRVSNGCARASGSGRRLDAGVDARFDVQVRQSLPFMDFSTAKWEMLVAVRNFFRDAAPDQSIYDELLVVRPPKRVVGGLTLEVLRSAPSASIHEFEAALRLFGFSHCFSWHVGKR